MTERAFTRTDVSEAVTWFRTNKLTIEIRPVGVLRQVRRDGEPAIALADGKEDLMHSVVADYWPTVEQAKQALVNAFTARQDKSLKELLALRDYLDNYQP